MLSGGVDVGSLNPVAPSGPETEDWWRSCLETKKNVHPFVTGTILGTQSLHLMAGTGPYNSCEDLERKAEVVGQKPILIGVLNAVSCEAELKGKASDGQLRALAQQDVDRLTELEFTIDGNKILHLENSKDYYVDSGPFTVNLPDNNILDVKAGITKAHSAGFWVKIDSLPRRERPYVITSGGTSGPNAFHTRVQYELTVK
jgi:hypothetical protein